MGTITVSIRLARPINKNVNKVSQILGMTKSAYIRTLIMEDLKQYGLIAEEIMTHLEPCEDKEVSEQQI